VNGLGFSRYLSAVALLTSFLRGLLNKAILRVDDLRPQPAQILQRYRFRFHRDAVYRMAALVGTTVCARARVCVVQACIEYIVDATPRAGAWLPYRARRGHSFLSLSRGIKNERDARKKNKDTFQDLYIAINVTSFLLCNYLAYIYIFFL